MPTPRTSFHAPSWRFIAGWLAAIVAGGLLGALIDVIVSGNLVRGLGMGVVAGNLVAVGVVIWRGRGQSVPPLPDVNSRLLRPTLVLTALGSLVYLAAGWAGVRFNWFFPWDGVSLLALCVIAAVLQARGQTYWAASCLLGGVFIPVAFNAQLYGMSSPVNAVYLLGLLISGLVVGSNGFFGSLAAICTLTLLFAIGEQQGQWETLYPVGTPAQSAGLVFFWWALYGAGAWLSWLFARTLERAVHVARGQTLALAHTLTALTPASSQDSLLPQTLAAMAEQLGAAYALVWLHEPHTDTLRMHRAHRAAGPAAPALEAPSPLPAGSLPLWAELKQQRRPLAVDDVANEPRLAGAPQFRAVNAAPGIQSILYVPLLTGTEVSGFFSLHRLEKRRPSAEELELAQALAQQVTLAMQLARLAEQDQQAALLAERNRLARDIHDTLAQGFTGIVIQLEAAEDVLGQDEAQAHAHLDRARALARASLAEARRSVYALRPQSLEHTPLPHALRASLEALTAQTPLRLDWELPEHWPAVAPALEEDLLRMAQEAVTNVLKHARARQVEVRLSATDGQLVLEVRDDGVGFVPPAGPGSAQGGFGLLGLRERAERHGGTVTVESTLGKGTVMRCLVPYKNA